MSLFSRVLVFDKSGSFPKFDVSDELFVSAKQVDVFMKDEAELFMILASMRDERKFVIDELTMVCDFLEVFPDDINDLSLKSEIKFIIDLVLGTYLMSITPYGMSASEYSKLKKQLE